MASEPILLDDTSRRNLKPGDVVRIDDGVFAEVTSHIFPSLGNPDVPMIGARDANGTYLGAIPVSRVTGILPTPTTPDPRDDKIAALEATITALVAATEPFTEYAAWHDEMFPRVEDSHNVTIDYVSDLSVAILVGDLRKLRAAIIEACE